MTACVNNGASTLRADHAQGDGLLKVKAGEGARFGTAFPLRVTVQAATGSAYTIFKVTGRAADDLTIAPADEGTVDQAWPAGTAVENRWTAGAVAELAALAGPNVFTGGLTVHSHSAHGAGGVIDAPDPGAFFWGTTVVSSVMEDSTDLPAGGGNRIGLLAGLNVNPPATPNNVSYRGLIAEINVPAPCPAALGNLTVNATYGKHQGTGKANAATALDARWFITGSGGAGVVTAIYIGHQFTGTGPVTTGIGIQIDPPSGGAPLTNAQGILIGDHSTSGAPNHYNLRSSGVNSLNQFEGRVRIGPANIDPSSNLDVQGTTRGFLPPRMTTVQRNAIVTPAEGLMVYDTTLHALCFRRATDWLVIGGAPGTMEAEPTPDVQQPAEQNTRKRRRRRKGGE